MFALLMVDLHDLSLPMTSLYIHLSRRYMFSCSVCSHIYIVSMTAVALAKQSALILLFVCVVVLLLYNYKFQ